MWARRKTRRAAACRVNYLIVFSVSDESASSWGFHRSARKGYCFVRTFLSCSRRVPSFVRTTIDLLRLDIDTPILCRQNKLHLFSFRKIKLCVNSWASQITKSLLSDPRSEVGKNSSLMGKQSHHQFAFIHMKHKATVLMYPFYPLMGRGREINCIFDETCPSTVITARRLCTIIYYRCYINNHFIFLYTYIFVKW